MREDFKNEQGAEEGDRTGDGDGEKVELRKLCRN